ncbi:MAG TPA: DUF5916 domain-containing protein [Vicinamibacteria bacterium]|nr:DUF5916 domain-containing protein [Vicinamibacteria bacterium]
MIPLILALALQDAPTSGGVSVQASRINEHIEIDGLLDEPAWASAVPATGFRQRDPDEGAPATEDTIIRVLYDNDTLYVGVLALDREPARIISRILQRDTLMQQVGDNSFQFAGDDALALILDPFQDHRNAFLFATNPNGAEFDALVTDESPVLNVDWRGIWRVAARRTRDGWSAEFAIPFRTLRYPRNPSGHAWGFNVERLIRRKNEDTLWSGWSRAQGGLHRVSQAGRLEGLSGLPRSSFNIEVKPYGLAGVTQPSGNGLAQPSEGQWRVGGDAKWEIEPGLVADAAVKPDFAQVEADDQVVNLTRFELYRPEKREFFLENAGFFDFGTRGSFETPPFLMFFSRRIGIAGTGEVPVLGGVRVSGRTGRQTVGFVDVVTEAASGEPRTNFGALRYKRDVGDRSYVGMMVTDRHASGSAETDLGVDASIWATPVLQLEGFAARTSKSGASPDSAYRVSAQYQGFPVYLSGEFLQIGPGATTGMGFVTRTDIRRTDGKAQYTFLPHVLGLRSLTPFVGGQYLTRVNGEKQDTNWFSGFALTWDSGESLSVTHVRGISVLDGGFPLADRVPITPGHYVLRDTEISASTSAKRSVEGSAQVSLFDNWGGRLSTVSVAVQLRADTHWSIGFSGSRSQASMPGGSFVASVTALRLGWTPTTRLTAATYLQYNSLTRRFVANFRADFIHHPGSDLFVVFNEERGTEALPLALVDRGFAVKLNYLFRL